MPEKKYQRKTSKRKSLRKRPPDIPMEQKRKESTKRSEDSFWKKIQTIKKGHQERVRGFRGGGGEKPRKGGKKKKAFRRKKARQKGGKGFERDGLLHQQTLNFKTAVEKKRVSTGKV